MKLNLSQNTPSRSQLNNTLFKREESFSELLPYDEFLPEFNIMQLKDGSFGAVYEVETFEHETLTSNEVIKAVQACKHWFSMPENCTLQICYDQALMSKNDFYLKQIEDGLHDAHDTSKFVHDRKMQDIDSACDEKAKSPIFKRKTLLSLRYSPKSKKTHPLRHLFSKDAHAELQATYREYMAEFYEFRSILADLTQGSSVTLKALGAGEILEILRRVFNPKSFYQRSFARYNANATFSNQCVFSPPELDHEGICCEGIRTRTMTLKTSPLISYPGGMAYFTSLKFPFKLSLCISFPSKAKIKRYFDLKEFFLQNSPSARSRIQRDEITTVQERLAKDDRCMHMTFNVIIDGTTDEELDEKERAVARVFQQELDCEVITEKNIGLGLMLNSLPLFYTPDADLSSQRYIKILRSDIVNFLPIFDSFRGFKSAVAVHTSREGNVVPFNLLENETSNHTVVLADSGSGKSAFVIDWIISAKRLSPEPLVFVIDKKSSYATLAKYYDGDVTVFDRNKDIPFSPFRGYYDEEKIAFLTRLIISAVKLISPNFEIESEHIAGISKALAKAHVKKKKELGLSFFEGELTSSDHDSDIVITMDDVIAQLSALEDSNNSRQAIDELIGKLRPFYGDGVYAKFFSAKPSAEQNKNCKFYVYDLDALDGDPILQSLMTMSVIEEIRRIISLPENQGRTGFIVMEEFAMLGRNNPAFRDFAIDFAETMRKRGVWLITLTPRPQNYFELEVGKAFWSVADNFIFLQMNSDNVDYVAEKSSLLDEASKEIIRSLKTKKGEYADVFYMNKKKDRQGALRYRQTAVARWLSPTNAEDLKRVNEAFEKLSDRWDVMDYLTDN